MKTKLLTLLLFSVASVLYSCTKESDNSVPDGIKNNDAPLTYTQRRIINSNCSGHGGCHSSARLTNVASLRDANFLLRTAIDRDHQLSACERNKLQLWFNSEGKQE